MGFPGGSDSRESTCNAGDVGWEDPLEKEMVTNSSILSWRTPWTEEPGRLTVHGVTKSWTWLIDWAHTHTHTHKCIHNSKNISLQDKLEKTLIGKDPDPGKDWWQEEKGMTEDEMVGCHHWLNGHEFEQALGVGDGQGGLACCSPWGHSRTWLID